MERYFTPTREVQVGDRMAEGVLQTVMEAAKRAYADPSDYDAQAQLMWCSTLAHNNLLGVDRVQDWASHQLEHELSARYDIAHGAGLAVVFPAWMRYVYQQDIPRFVQFANRVFGIAVDVYHPERTALAGIEALEGFLRTLQLPLRLHEVGIDETYLREMAEKTKKTNLPQENTVGNFQRLTSEDCYRIYQSVL